MPTNDTNDIDTGKKQDDDDWVLINYTPFTEPLWGIVVNK
jgi:hypothetical protein